MNLIRNRYIEELNQTGACKANVDFICKKWNEKFSIATWINDKEDKYILYISGRGKNNYRLKVHIFKEQALEIASKLDLVHVKNSLFKSAGTYMTKEFVYSEIKRLEAMRENKRLELNAIDAEIGCYERCLLN